MEKTALFAFNGEMMGHPAMAEYIEKGYRIITF